jgi:hypothetical protein
MPGGGHGKTSTILYYRGVPKTLTNFGALAAGNYSIFQPSGRPDIRSDFFKKSVSNFIAGYR